MFSSPCLFLYDRGNFTSSGKRRWANDKGGRSSPQGRTPFGFLADEES
jgi:hypothetical protein